MTDQNNAAQAVDLANRAREWAMQRGSVENFPATARAHIRGLADALLSKLRAEGVLVATLERVNGASVHTLLPAAASLPDGDYALYLAPAALASAPVAPAEVMDALNWVDDFIARCNGDDVGTCKSVNVLRRALASAPVAGEAQRVFLVPTGEVYCGQETYTRHEGQPPVNSDNECLYAAPQASEAVRDAALEEAAKRIEGGSFLHEDSEVARFVRDIAKAVRALKHHPADKDGAVCSCPSGDGSLRHPCAAHPDCAKGAGDATGRTPPDYTLQHADHMAVSAERLMEAINNRDAVIMQREESDDVDDDTLWDQHENVSEYLRGMQEAIYEYRKRRNRAALSAQPGAQKYWLCCGSKDPNHPNRRAPDCFNATRAKWGTADQHSAAQKPHPKQHNDGGADA